MRFRRKAADEPDPTDLPDAEPGEEPTGPWDADDPDLPEVERVDLGSLQVVPVAGTELRLQVDEKSGQVQAVLLAGRDGALELRAFAAPRNGDLWSEVRPQIAADMARRGGVASEGEGPFGPELHCEMTTTLADGRTGKQLSRIVGVTGPRWLLRATFIGAPARGGETAEAWEQALRAVVVRRGQQAMPVGEALPVTMPEGARPVRRD